MSEWAHWRREWSGIWGDPWLRALVAWIPLLLGVWVCLLFQGGLVRELPIGLIDQDHSALSRQLARALNASAAMRLEHEYLSLEEGARALRSGDIYALILLPHQLEKQVRQSRQPVVTAFYNSQLLLVGRLLGSAIQQTMGTVNTRLATVGALRHQPVTLAALGESLPIRTQLTPLYNASGNYAQFLLPPILAALWQMVILIASISCFVHRQRSGHAGFWQNGSRWRALVLALSPYWLIYTGWGVLLSALMFGVFGWPMVGSWGLLLLGQGLMVLAVLAMGALLYWLVRDGARAMSLAAGYAAPAFAFLGVTFPTSQMDHLALFWRSLLPVSHYIELQIGQASIGLLGPAAWAPLWSLLPFMLIWPLVALLMRRGAHG